MLVARVLTHITYRSIKQFSNIRVEVRFHFLHSTVNLLHCLFQNLHDLKGKNGNVHIAMSYRVTGYYGSTTVESSCKLVCENMKKTVKFLKFFQKKFLKGLKSGCTLTILPYRKWNFHSSFY